MELTGPAVLIPWTWGVKGDDRTKWKHLTLESMQNPKHLARLYKPDINIGIANGDPSDGLVPIDADSDEAEEQLVALNPILRETLCSKGIRTGIDGGVGGVIDRLVCKVIRPAREILKICSEVRGGQ